MEQPPSISLYERTEDDTSALGDGIAKLSLDQIDDHPQKYLYLMRRKKRRKYRNQKRVNTPIPRTQTLLKKTVKFIRLVQR